MSLREVAGKHKVGKSTVERALREYRKEVLKVEGYMGRVLFINLTSGSIGEEILPDEVYRYFIRCWIRGAGEGVCR